ncbi:protein G12-like [Uranotaenia lowii]|uniref:protein G12-like n=1 Tax=Uranotaenia lowii TaxID=190385 RepID=UPI002478C9F2|nr:protein G12-like [Uranotaenia lowii]
MKILSIFGLVLVAVVAASSSVQSQPSRSLQSDLDEFVQLLPFEKIVNIALKYFLIDAEVKAAVEYILGPEFGTIWDQVFSLREVLDILDYLQDAGIDAYGAINDLADLIGVNHVEPSRPGVVSRTVSTRGLNALIDEVLSVLPKDELLALFEQKLQTSAEFKAFFEKIQSTEFKNLVEFFNNSAKLQSLFQKLREHGVDVDKIIELIKGFFGWNM